MGHKKFRAFFNLVTKPHSKEEIFIHKGLATSAEKGILQRNTQAYMSHVILPH